MCVTIAFLATRSTVTAIRCSLVYKGLEDRSPEYIKCVGNGTEGDWKKKNGKKHLLGRFNTTNVELIDTRYGIQTFWQKGLFGSFLDLPRGDFGRFFGRIGNETKTINVPMILGANGYSRADLLELTCTPPGGFRLRSNSREGPRKKGTPVTYPPFNVTWFINGTMIGKSINCTGPSCGGIIYYPNASIYNHWNATILGDKIIVNTTDPLCLMCRVSMRGLFGKNSLCTPNTVDVRVKNKNGAGLFGGNLRLLLKGHNPDTDPQGSASSLSGTTVLAGSVMIVCAIAGAFYILTQIRNKKRHGPDLRLAQKIYKPVNSNPGRFAESVAL